MAQRNPEEKAAIEKVLKLVEELSPEGREEVLYELQLQDLRREIQKGINSAERGIVYSEEEALARLRAHRQKVIERQVR
jgi:hypothetical protein